MDVEGSKYDAAGENKHLFYCFFEKERQRQRRIAKQAQVAQNKLKG